MPNQYYHVNVPFRVSARYAGADCWVNLHVMRATMNAQGVTSADLHRRTRLSRSTINNLFRGRRITMPSLRKLCDALGLPLSDVVESIEPDEIGPEAPMLMFVDKSNGLAQISLGLSFENLDRLREGRPMLVNVRELGVEVDVLVMARSTERALRAEMRPGK